RRRHTRLQGDWSSDVCSSDLVFTADGEHFASLTKDGSVGIWETLSGKEVTRLPAVIPPYFTVVLSPDGKHLAAANVGFVQVLEEIGRASCRERVESEGVEGAV